MAASANYPSPFGQRIASLHLALMVLWLQKTLDIYIYIVYIEIMKKKAMQTKQNMLNL